MCVGFLAIFFQLKMKQQRPLWLVGLVPKTNHQEYLCLPGREKHLKNIGGVLNRLCVGRVNLAPT